MVWSCLMGVLGTEFWSSARASSQLLSHAPAVWCHAQWVAQSSKLPTDMSQARQSHWDFLSWCFCIVWGTNHACLVCLMSFILCSSSKRIVLAYILPGDRGVLNCWIPAGRYIVISVFFQQPWQWPVQHHAHPWVITQRKGWQWPKWHWRTSIATSSLSTRNGKWGKEYCVWELGMLLVVECLPIIYKAKPKQTRKKTLRLCVVACVVTHKESRVAAAVLYISHMLR